MKRASVVLFSFVLFWLPLCAHAQSWSGILDPSRATTWSGAGIAGGIPSRTTVCTSIAAYGTSVSPGSPATINNAISACPSGQVVLLQAGTFYLNAGITFSGISNVTLRGSGPLATIVIFSGSGVGCLIGTEDVCMLPSTVYGPSSPAVLPGGSNSCNWTAGYLQNANTITLTGCGSGNLVNGTVLTLDQANDFTDTGGVMICDDDTVFTCHQNLENGSGGRTISGSPVWNGATSYITAHYSQQQYVTVTSGCASACTGAGPFTVGISPPLYDNNWRASQTPGAFWLGMIQQDGIENVTLDHTAADPNITAAMNISNCYECWVKNIRSIKGARNHIWLTQTANVVIRDSYFYGSLNSASESYGVECFGCGNTLIENNIIDRTAGSIMFGGGQGLVVSYNYAIVSQYTPSDWMQQAYAGHDAGDSYSLWEGNHLNGIACDAIHGSSAVETFFRNRLDGQFSGVTQNTYPVALNSYCRGFNIVGNVLGVSGYYTSYECYPGGSVTSGATSVYSIGWSGGSCGTNNTEGVVDDTMSRSTLMRWGNYDTVNAAVRWDSTESSPGAVTYISAQSTPASHTLPASFYLSARPSFWTTTWGTPPWPPIGPDVTGGNIPNVGGYANQIPAEMCYLNTPIDSTYGSPILAFDANSCYTAGASAPAPPTNLAVTLVK